ncbi:PadR family transcriptional regulator [Halomonas sp. SBBP1]|nr:PadR family transcriptional regulator [Halomonas sp. SBBP1]
MRGDGLLTCETLPQTERPDRKVYQLTEAGRQALDIWLAEPLFASHCLPSFSPGNAGPSRPAAKSSPPFVSSLRSA